MVSFLQFIGAFRKWESLPLSYGTTNPTLSLVAFGEIAAAVDRLETEPNPIGYRIKPIQPTKLYNKVSHWLCNLDGYRCALGGFARLEQFCTTCTTMGLLLAHYSNLSVTK